MEKYIYSFNEGSRDMRNLLGGKGANLAEMTRIGLPVPFGFTVTTQACRRYYEEDCTIGEDIIAEMRGKIAELENVTGRTFGSKDNPLLLSVRSGSVISMPGMMDTILDLGLNDESVEGLAALTGNRRFALDSYRRFIQMFGDIVLGIPRNEFERIFENSKKQGEDKSCAEPDICCLESVISEYKKLVRTFSGADFPQNPDEQLIKAVEAVFSSWNNERAVLYRRINDIPQTPGTAVSIQSMVFGNLGETSGTGIAFTRDTITGERKICGEFLLNAQGEDVAAGLRKPMSITEMESFFPEVFRQFVKISELLEKHYKDVQEMEFTIENNRLYMLQTRTGRRTGQAAVKIAVDMVEEGLIDKKTAVTRVSPEQVEQLMNPVFSAESLAEAQPVASGLPISPGAVSGRIYFDVDDVIKASQKGIKAILVRDEAATEDLAGIEASEGLLAARGSMTSHASVVARVRGKCCISGCTDLEIDYSSRILKVGKLQLKEGDYISLDGSTGLIYEGIISAEEPSVSGDFRTLLEWADEIRELKVRANADNPEEARKALELGAEGIGLCRTEHMFLESSRITAMRCMIMADTEEEKKIALEKIKPYQQSDFREIFKVMGENPVTIRLLDPSLHKFLPETEEDIRNLADIMGVSAGKIREKSVEMRDQNVILGNRGCRLAITDPEIAVMQTEAIISAAAEVMEEYNIEIVPEIMIPLPSTRQEVSAVKQIIAQTAERCIRDLGIKMNYMVGTMIETPRAALIAGELAQEAEFFSFGTNDLTQMTYGLSSNDTGKLIDEYIRSGILAKNPFKTLDLNGVGRLIRMAAEQGKQERARLKLGMCGEHGGDPATINFCCEIGLNYISCSPARVPVARIAAAQAVVNNEKDEKRL